MKIILVDGKLSEEKLKQILKRYASKGEEDFKTTLADVWPRKEKGNDLRKNAEEVEEESSCAKSST